MSWAAAPEGIPADRAGRFRSIDVGGFRIDRPLLFWPLTRPDGSFGETEISGNLGNPLLKNFIVYFDYAHERVILEKGADFNRDFPEDHSGLQLACSETGDMIVFFVSPGTPAARAGFQKGDRIVAIDGAVPEKFAALPAIRQLLKGNPGTILRFRVGRRGKIRNAQLTLSDLFAAQ